MGNVFPGFNGSSSLLEIKIFILSFPFLSSDLSSLISSLPFLSPLLFFPPFPSPPYPGLSVLTFTSAFSLPNFENVGFIRLSSSNKSEISSVTTSKKFLNALRCSLSSFCFSLSVNSSKTSLILDLHHSLNKDVSSKPSIKYTLSLLTQLYSFNSGQSICAIRLLDIPLSIINDGRS